MMSRLMFTNVSHTAEKVATTGRHTAEVEAFSKIGMLPVTSFTLITRLLERAA
jgi:hypothetical protein